MRIIPSYSVVIPLFNARGTILRAVRSVVGQSVVPDEVIVVDDGSTDGSGELLEAERLPGVRVVRQAHAGVSAARNRGIEEASGDYVGFLDAGDWWDEDFLHHMTNLIKNYPQAGLYCAGYWIHRRGGSFLNEHKIRVVGLVKDVFRAASASNLCRMSACLMPRRVLLETGGFPVGMHHGEDVYLWTKAAVRYPVCYSPARLSNYVVCTHGDPEIRKPAPGSPSLLDLRLPGNRDLDEHLAYYLLGMGIIRSVGGDTAGALEIQRACRHTRRHRLLLLELRILNRLSVPGRRRLLAACDRLNRFFSKLRPLE